MNMIARVGVLSLILCLGNAAYGVPLMDVTVSDAQGKLAGKALTKANGTFATTTPLPAGHYVVQFKARNNALKSDQYLLILTAGKSTVISNAFPGKNFSAGGVAIRMDVRAGKKITGQVASATELEKAHVQVVNGRRYYWVASDTGSHLGGKWVAESDARAQYGSGISMNTIQKIQDTAGEGSMHEHHRMDYAPDTAHGP
jgi:hypothetical protein